MLTRLQALQNKEVARALGHLTFMGINCKRNHGAIRYTVDGACVECRKINNRHTQARLKQRRKQMEKHVVDGPCFDVPVMIMGFPGRVLHESRC